jgi:hypothetical protein
VKRYYFSYTRVYDGSVSIVAENEDDARALFDEMEEKCQLRDEDENGLIDIEITGEEDVEEDEKG